MSRSLSKLFSKYLTLDPLQHNHHHQRKNSIDDDWEFIEFLDRELSGDEDDDGSVSINGDFEIGNSEILLHNNNNIKIKYRILSTAELLQRLENKITKVSTVLLLPRNEAAILLQHFKWSVSRTNDEWLACEEKVRKAVGLFVRPAVKTTLTDAAQITCKICHQEFPRDLMLSASCGHQICCSCWEDHIKEAIDDGPRCLTLRCPELSCDAAVGPYMIRLLSSKHYKKKFENLLLRSYIAQRRKARWCPTFNCNHAVFSSNGGENDVTCRCLHSFCWSCLGEAHAPVDCSTPVVWMSEGARQTENWMLANTITCRMCTFRGYVDSNYTYARCSYCNHEFCSICGDDWSNHVVGDLWLDSSCPRAPLQENIRKEAANSLQKYRSHYEEWINYGLARENAAADLLLYQERLDFMCANFGIPPKELNFLLEALLQAISCWQVLKWTHVYGFYMPDHEHAKKHLFEFLQEQAACLVRGLHKELQDVLFEDISLPMFMNSKAKITKLTRVTRNFFDQMVKGLEAGLPEVESSPTPTVMEDDTNIISTVGSTMSDDSWFKSSPMSSPMLEPELQHESKIKTE